MAVHIDLHTALLYLCHWHKAHPGRFSPWNALVEFTAEKRSHRVIDQWGVNVMFHGWSSDVHRGAVGSAKLVAVGHKQALRGRRGTAVPCQVSGLLQPSVIITIAIDYCAHMRELEVQWEMEICTQVSNQHAVPSDSLEERKRTV
jgi:hypothetical protein